MTTQKLKELWKPIAQGLFGKQGTGGYRYQRPDFELRPLEMMLEDLTAIPPEEWYGYAFSNEPLNGKFNDAQRKEFTVRSIACGREYAQKTIKKYGTDEPERLARAMNLLVDYPSYPEKTDRVLFAEFRAPNSICIYTDALQRARVQLRNPDVQKTLTEQLNISGLLLSHELFHFVEEECKAEIFTRTQLIELWHLGSYHHRSHVIAFSEIAAMAFAAEITKLPYSPYVMDVFLVYGYSPPEACGLYESMMERAGRTPRSAEKPQEIADGATRRYKRRLQKELIRRD